MDTKILENHQEKLISLFKNVKKFKLLYRYTKDGHIREFYNKHSGIKPTLVVLKSDNDSVFGGYTDIGWENNIYGGKLNQNNYFIFTIKQDGSIETFKSI